MHIYIYIYNEISPSIVFVAAFVHNVIPVLLHFVLTGMHVVPQFMTMPILGMLGEKFKVAYWMSMTCKQVYIICNASA